MRTTREIRATVRARLEAEAERQAKENADARRRARADYEAAKGSRRRKSMEGARAAWMAAERKPTEAVEVVAGWTLQDVYRAAGAVPEGEADVARSAAAVCWHEARARVALRDLFNAVQGAVFSERLYGGEGNLRELTKERLEAMAGEERDKILWEEIRNVILSTVRRTEEKTNFLVGEEKRKAKKRSQTAKENPRSGKDEVEWSRFLPNLDKKLLANKHLPAKQRKTQENIIDAAIATHNGRSQFPITIGWTGVYQRLKRWRKDRQSAR